jgi:hypothetical protein
MKLNNNLKSYFVLVSTIIGLGIFTLPYVFWQSGVYFILWLVFIFFISFILNLIFGEILLQTDEKHNLPGLAGKYLHPFAKHLVWFFDYFGMLGVFLIYLIALVKLWTLIIPLADPLVVKAIFVLINLYFILKDMRIFVAMESVLTIGILVLSLLIIAILLPKVDLNKISLALKNTFQPLLPYGAFLFAFAGTSALPVIVDLIGKDKKSFAKINFLALLTVALLYLFYALIVVGVLDGNVSEESLQSLAPYFPKFFLIFAVLFVTLNITFVDMAFYLKRGLVYDYNIPSGFANVIMFLSILPLIFFNNESLIELIEIISSVFLGFNLLVLSLIYLNLKEKKYFSFPSILVIVLALIFLVGIFYGILPKRG